MTAAHCSATHGRKPTSHLAAAVARAPPTPWMSHSTPPTLYASGTGEPRTTERERAGPGAWVGRGRGDSGMCVWVGGIRGAAEAACARWGGWGRGVVGSRREGRENNPR
eukprot:scaffold11554_cov98-Isochrysis_galbana.AAC.6